jgi:hypothetical protein
MNLDQEMYESWRRLRDGLPEEGEGVIFVTVLVVATLLIFAGGYAMRTGSEVEVTGIGDLDIIGSGVAAIGFLLFGFNFFVGLRKVTTLSYPMAAKLSLVVPYCLLSAGLARLAWLLGAG